jgi:hypothetical protein
MWGGMLHRLLQDPAGTIEHARALRSLAAKHPVFEGLADENMARGLILQGRWDEGIAYSRQAVLRHKASDMISHLTWAKLDEIEFLAAQQHADEGLILVAEALAETEEYALLRAPVLRLRADLFARGNADTSEVDLAYRVAIECARSQGAKFHELLASTSYARWLNSQGRSVEAQSLLADIYGWFTEGFDTPALSEAKALLDELNTKPNALRRSNKSRKGR